MLINKWIKQRNPLILWTWHNKWFYFFSFKPIPCKKNTVFIFFSAELTSASSAVWIFTPPTNYVYQPIDMQLSAATRSIIIKIQGTDNAHVALLQNYNSYANYALYEMVFCGWYCMKSAIRYHHHGYIIRLFWRLRFHSSPQWKMRDLSFCHVTGILWFVSK